MNDFILFLVKLILPAKVGQNCVIIEAKIIKKQFSQKFIAKSNLFSLYILQPDDSIISPNIETLDFILQSELMNRVIPSVEKKYIYCRLEDLDIQLEINKEYFYSLYCKLSCEKSDINFPFNLLIKINEIFPPLDIIINQLKDLELSSYFLEMLKNKMITEDMIRAIMLALKDSKKRICNSLPGYLKDILKNEQKKSLPISRAWLEQSLFISRLNSYTLLLKGKFKVKFISSYKSLLLVYYSSVINKGIFVKQLLQVKKMGKLQFALSQGKTHDWINVINFLNEDELLIIEKESSKRNFSYLLKERKFHKTTETEFAFSAYHLMRLFVKLKNEENNEITLDDLVASLDSYFVFNWILWEMGLVDFVSALKTLRQTNYKLILADLTLVAQGVLSDIIDSKIVLLSKNCKKENMKARSELKAYLLFLLEIEII